MPLILQRVALAANGTSNVLRDSLFESLPFDALVEIGMSTDATGVLATVQSGMDTLMEEGPVQVGTINVQPRYPDDYFLKDVAAAGEKIKIALRDTSGAARVVMVGVKIEPIE